MHDAKRHGLKTISMLNVLNVVLTCDNLYRNLIETNCFSSISLIRFIVTSCIFDYVLLNSSFAYFRNSPIVTISVT